MIAHYVITHYVTWIINGRPSFYSEGNDIAQAYSRFNAHALFEIYELNALFPEAQEVRISKCSAIMHIAARFQLDTVFVLPGNVGLV